MNNFPFLVITASEFVKYEKKSQTQEMVSGRGYIRKNFWKNME